ncbi:hypothetical protein AKJ44_01530 [candidate division MSBL1 archaeon SCGC-AAA261F17]|uniref:CARDB domain-containing protein n=1 Tax=candidate division MSBL1 archaeon SCGC-AAA261F17 TaxID=1698274 RepID=A0A133V6I1_9EURY|nr:hypothetical protein AKJ44_01530 [candidate division MSBL1 archaeon SCGC-AAA261F17]
MVVSKPEVEPGETTTISADVTNTGGTPSTYTVELSIEGEMVDSRDVPLDPGDSETISFDVAKEEPGAYDFAVDDLTGSFDVRKPPAFPWATVIAIIVIIAAIIAVGIWYWTRGRRTG